MESKSLCATPLLWFVAILLMTPLLAACQTIEFYLDPSSALSSATPISNSTPAAKAIPVEASTAAPSVTPIPSPTQTATVAPTNTPAPPKLSLDPCHTKLLPIDAQYPNPQENLDALSGTTWMMITVAEGILSEQDNFHYWWDTRAFRGDLSFNKGGGTCITLIETNQIKCEGLPLRGTDNLPTGGYEYVFSLYIQGHECMTPPNYMQVGLIFMDTLKHDVYAINGEDAP